MKPVIILSHMAVFAMLVCLTLVGLAGVEQNGGGYLWEFMCIGAPFVLGLQIMFIITSGE